MCSFQPSQIHPPNESQFNVGGLNAARRITGGRHCVGSTHHNQLIIVGSSPIYVVSSLNPSTRHKPRMMQSELTTLPRRAAMLALRPFVYMNKQITDFDCLLWMLLSILYNTGITFIILNHYHLIN